MTRSLCGSCSQAACPPLPRGVGLPRSLLSVPFLIKPQRLAVVQPGSNRRTPCSDPPPCSSPLSSPVQATTSRLRTSMQVSPLPKIRRRQRDLWCGASLAHRSTTTRPYSRHDAVRERRGWHVHQHLEHDGRPEHNVCRSAAQHPGRKRLHSTSTRCSSPAAISAVH